MVKIKALSLTPNFFKRGEKKKTTKTGNGAKFCKFSNDGKNQRVDFTDQNRVDDWKRGNGHGFDPLGVSPATLPGQTHTLIAGEWVCNTVQNTQQQIHIYTNTRTNTNTKYTSGYLLPHTPIALEWTCNTVEKYSSVCRIPTVGRAHFVPNLIQNSSWAATAQSHCCGCCLVRFPYPRIRLTTCCATCAICTNLN